MENDCPYIAKCCDKGEKCNCCFNNSKKSYFQPVYPMSPNSPGIPNSTGDLWPEYFPTITINLN